MVGNEPAKGAGIYLLPADMFGVDPKTPPKNLVSASADDFGEFTVMTNGILSGAPAGTYMIGVTWYDPTVEKDRDGDQRGRQLIPVKYTNPRTSEMRIEVAQSKQLLFVEVNIDPTEQRPAEVIVRN